MELCELLSCDGTTKLGDPFHPRVPDSPCLVSRPTTCDLFFLSLTMNRTTMRRIYDGAKTQLPTMLGRAHTNAYMTARQFSSVGLRWDVLGSCLPPTQALTVTNNQGFARVRSLLKDRIRSELGDPIRPPF